MKTLALVALFAASACVSRGARVQTVSETTASAPVCKEIALPGKPARCEAVAPSSISSR